MPSVIPASTLINSSISNGMMNPPTNLPPTDSSVPSYEGIASKHDSQLMQHMFRAFVGKALDDKSSGNVAAYEDMRRQFSIRPDAKDAPSSIQIQNLLSALTCNVSRLDSSCSSLIMSILGSVWVSRDESFVRCYTKFLGHLLSAQSTYLPLVMTMLIQHMCYQSNSLAIHYEHAHMALKYVLDLVPRAHSYLYSCILEEFPYKDESILAQMTYISNVLSICEYVPSLKGPVLHAVIDKIIQVDVEIQVELDIEDDEDSDASDASDDAASDVLTASALYERHADASEDLTSSTLLNDDPLSPVDTKQTLLQLDQLLYILFSYLSKNLNQSRDRYVVYNSLIRSFVNTVLKTFRCRYTQFLIFWASQLNPEFTDIFLGVLTEVCLNPSQPYTLRISGAMYLGSYVSRAKTLEASTIQIIVGLMTRWMEAYLDQCENELSDDLISKHSVFYAINQSVLYIYCFRWQELRISDETDPMDPRPAEWLPGLEVLHRSVLSRLNPLRYCSPNIVHQFARIAHHLNFMYVYSILEQNRKGSIRDGLETIDSFFPFDPYRLSKSSSIVQPFYNEWRPVPGMDDVEEAEDEPMSDYPLVPSL